jgi:hypothetical protein
MTAADVTRSAAWFAALVAGALAETGCGGGDANPLPSYTKIADMEGSGNLLEWVGPSGTATGGWFTATDCTQHDRIDPPSAPGYSESWSFAALPTPQQTMPGIVSTHATRLRTTAPLVDIWGANVGFAFATTEGDGGSPGPVDAGFPTDDTGACMSPPNNYPNPPVDLTGYAGVTFWARAASPGGRAVRVQFNDVSTDPRGGICQEKDSNSSDDYCYNGFGVLIELTDTFRQYTLDLSTFTQRGGWGYHPPAGVDWSRVFTMSFEMDLPSCTSSATSMCPGGAPELSFDIWIDDLYFVNK